MVDSAPSTGTARHFKFTAVGGLFVDFADLFEKDPAFRVTTLPGLGLIDQDYETGVTGAGAQGGKPSWSRFVDHVRSLNEQAPGSTKYKIVYLTRHGFGWHNYQEAKVGTEAWDKYWSRLDGEGDIVWADAHLTPEGISQANALGRFWSDGTSNEGIPLPGTVYTSPLARCLETTRLGFGPAFEKSGASLRPAVKELLRETIIEHTCDRRSSRSWIAENYPDYVIEPGFSEDDKLWASRNWESLDDHIARKQRVFDEIFSTDGNLVVSLTIHSGAISAVLGMLKHRKFLVREGSSFAFLIRADEA